MLININKSITRCNGIDNIKKDLELDIFKLWI